MNEPNTSDRPFSVVKSKIFIGFTKVYKKKSVRSKTCV